MKSGVVPDDDAVEHRTRGSFDGLLCSPPRDPRMPKSPSSKKVAKTTPRTTSPRSVRRSGGASRATHTNASEPHEAIASAAASQVVATSSSPASAAEPIAGPARPSKPPAPITGTAAMKTLARRNAAALRPSTSVGSLSDEARRVLDEGGPAAVAALGEALALERNVPATAKLIDEILSVKPEHLVPLVDRFASLVGSSNKRVAQTCALALPVMARLAPARVARHLQALTDVFPTCSDAAKDGLVSTFAALCMASVAYQKRLEPVLELALASADPKVLPRWSEIILPSLKGEPHARARAVVEGRLPSIPRQLAQPIANFLGVKLRPSAS